MKIQKFNERAIAPRHYVCMIIKDTDTTADYSGIFETEKDMNNWILNIINNTVMEKIKLGTYLGDIFTDLTEAINWYQDSEDCNIYYSEDVWTFKNVKLKYNVEILRNTKKYNI